ncbi:MAG: hypothetical protein ACK5JD_17255 [Mangrovibacterium sp.]
MKTQFKILSILLACITTSTLAQTVTLFTPNGSTVEAFYRSELSDTEIAELTQLYKTTYPEAEVLANASRTYNCHSYAWNITDCGNTICWLNQYPDLHKYWDDNSYIETTELNAEKIFYYTGDHSAVKSISSTGKYESKWGQAPLMRHSPGYGPNIYNMSYRKYYKKSKGFSISGPSTICTSGSAFSVNNLPSTVSSVVWETGPSLTVFSGQNTNSPLIKATGSGSSWVRARLLTACGEVTLPEKVVWVGKPTYSAIDMSVRFGPSSNELCIGAELAIVASHSQAKAQGITGFQWNFGGWSSYFTGYDEMPGKPNQSAAMFVLYPGASSSQYINVQAQNACGLSNSQSKAFYALNCYGGYYLSFSPNPSTDETTISLIQETTDGVAPMSAASASLTTDNREWDLEIYDSFQKLKLKKAKLRGSQFRLNTSGWREGVYVVRAHINNEIVSGKLLVKP